MVEGNGTNGFAHHEPTRPLTAGIYAPIPTFFLPVSEDLDITTFKAHIIRVAKTGVRPLLCGSMGEGHHLSHDERVVLIRAAREALDEECFEDMPIVSGTGAGSTRETIQLCKEAAAAGADATIVIASGYFAGVLAGNKQALKDFWTEVSEKSPIPVMIYNYPAAAGGIDLDSDLITELAMECPNLCGVKLTCGNVGKLTRICATVTDPSFDSLHPRTNANAPFLVLGGYSDFLVPSAFSNGHGAITGLANIAPHATVRLFELSQAALNDRLFLEEAQALQGIVGRADYTIAKAGISGTKFLLEKLYGYGGDCRKPLPVIPLSVGETLWTHPDTVALVQKERQLSGKV